MTQKTLEGRVALVTGASRGIGAAIAVELARRGAHPVLIARTQGGLEETDDAIRAVGGQATLLPFDLRQGEKIDTIGPSIHARFGRLDILVHNAAVLGTLTPVGHIQPRDFNETIAVNLAAAWRLIRTSDALLRASDAGRAVFMTSAIVTRPTAYWGMYGASKAAMDHLVRSWAAELATTNARAVLADPGVVRTQLRGQAMPGEDPATLPPPETVAPAIVDLCAPASQQNGSVIRVV